MASRRFLTLGVPRHVLDAIIINHVYLGCLGCDVTEKDRLELKVFLSKGLTPTRIRNEAFLI